MFQASKVSFKKLQSCIEIEHVQSDASKIVTNFQSVCSPLCVCWFLIPANASPGQIAEPASGRTDVVAPKFWISISVSEIGIEPTDAEPARQTRPWPSRAAFGLLRQANKPAEKV